MNALTTPQTIESIQAEYEAACAAIPSCAIQDNSGLSWEEFTNAMSEAVRYDERRMELRRIRDEKMRDLAEATARARKQVCDATKKAFSYLVFSCRI